MSLAPGELVLEDASRAFLPQASQARTLKDLVMRRSDKRALRVPALHEVTLRVAPGETLGLVGRNGAGKTSTLKVLAGIIPLDSGRVEAGGRVVSLLELGAGFARDLSGLENIFLGAAIHGLDRTEIEARADDIIAFSELGEFIDAPVRTYSNGMFVRLGFALAAHLDADVMLIDEVLAVGDEAFQRKCIRRISEHIARGATIVLVSHDAGQIEQVCERVVVLEAGEVVFDGATAEGLAAYRRRLGTDTGGGMSARPHHDRDVRVEELELRDPEGRARRVFRAGGPLRAVIGVSGTRREGRLVLEVRDATGQVVFRSEHDCEVPGRLEWEVERLALLGGDYDLAVAGDGGPAERLARFSVAPEPGAEGVVDLRGTLRPVGVEVAP